MKKIKDFPLFFKLLQENRKVLAIVKCPDLKELEERLGISLGASKPNKIRPCIFWKTNKNGNELFKLIFLTSSQKTYVSIDLNLCKEKNKRCGNFVFYPTVYVFQTPDGKILLITLKSPELLSNFVNCGPCENLENLEQLEQNLRQVIIKNF
jgi:hypothetical protein